MIFTYHGKEYDIPATFAERVIIERIELYPREVMNLKGVWAVVSEKYSDDVVEEWIKDGAK